MLDAQALAVEDAGSPVPDVSTTFVQRSHRYLGTMCETLRHDASKWSALLHLAELWGIDREEIVAVGDDMNDVPMIAGAGLGVAMGHAPEAVRNVADHVTHDEENDGLARFVEGDPAGVVRSGPCYGSRANRLIHWRESGSVSPKISGETSSSVSSCTPRRPRLSGWLQSQASLAEMHLAFILQ